MVVFHLKVEAVSIFADFVIGKLLSILYILVTDTSSLKYVCFISCVGIQRWFVGCDVTY